MALENLKMTQQLPNKSPFTATEFKVVPSTQEKEQDSFVNTLGDSLDTDLAFRDNLSDALLGFTKGAAEDKMKLFNEVMDNLGTGLEVEVEQPFSLAAGMMTLPEFQAKEYPPLVPLIENLLNEKEHMAIYGPSGAGKSMVALMLSVLMSAPDDLGVGPISNGGGNHKVLYLDGENSPQDAKNRVDNICGMFGVDQTKMPNLLYYNSEEMGAYLDLTDESHRKDIIKVARKQEIKLIVIDNYRTLFGGDENKSDTMSIFNKFLDKLKSVGTSAIVLHHTNKQLDNDGWPVYGGSTNFERPYWTMMKLRVKKGEGYTKENRRLALEYQMQKDRSGITGMVVKEDVGSLVLCEAKGITLKVDGQEPMQLSAEDTLVVGKLSTLLPNFLIEGYEIPDDKNKKAIWEEACTPYHNKKGYKDQASKVLPKLVKELQRKQRAVENHSPAFQRV
jgi:energy-coupling factor transporter ATP-binding protein EcfA2